MASSAPSVLVVDENYATCHTLAVFLGVHGYRVSEASGGEAALRMLAASSERLVVLIDASPNTNALALLQAVRTSTELARHHAYILMTAPTINAPERMPSSQLTDYLAELRIPVLAKPIGMDELLQVVHEASRHLDAEAD